MSSPSRGRKCGPKVRTGCVTCKIRRVKCDEGKPHCNRCTSVGRKCDGYLPVQVARRDRRQHYPFYMMSQDQSALEVLQYWSTTRLMQLFGLDSFWRIELRQLALREPAIQYALVALKSASEQTWDNDAFTIQAYNKSIQHLIRNYKSEKAEDICFVLVVCALFVCIEFIRGDLKAALKHIYAGVKLLENQSISMDRLRYSVAERRDDSMSVALIEIFSRFQFQSVTFDSSFIPRTFPEYEMGAPWPESEAPFLTLENAMADSFQIMVRALSLILIGMELKYTDGITLEMKVCQHKVTRRLESWHQKFGVLALQSASTWCPEQVRIAKTLEAQALFISIWTATCLDPVQVTLDAYWKDFETIISIAQQCFSLPVNPDFQIDMGLIPILHFCGVKCRDARLRRQILGILGSNHWREGFFDSFMVYRAIHRQMIIEERNLRIWEFPNLLPAECDRIHLSNYTGFVETSSGSLCAKLTLLSYPNGPHSSQCVWNEYIPVRGPLPTYEIVG